MAAQGDNKLPVARPHANLVVKVAGDGENRKVKTRDSGMHIPNQVAEIEVNNTIVELENQVILEESEESKDTKNDTIHKDTMPGGNQGSNKGEQDDCQASKQGQQANCQADKQSKGKAQRLSALPSNGTASTFISWRANLE